MGHVEGKGLGKHEQGRSEIVSQTKQLGRRGLGMNIEGFEASDEGWVFEEVRDKLVTVLQFCLIKIFSFNFN